MNILFDKINILLIITVCLSLFLGIIVFLNGRKKKINVVYSLNIIAIISWIVAMILYRSASPEISLFWCTILYITPTFIASSFLYFTYIFPSQKDKNIPLKSLLIFSINGLIVVMVALPSLIIKEVNIRPGLEKEIIFTKYYWFYFIYTVGFFSYGFLRLYKKYLKGIGIERLQVLYILLGYTLAGNLAFATNLIMPWIGFFFLNWLGQIFTIIMVGFASYAILKYHLLDINVVIKKAFFYSLGIALISGLIFGISFLNSWFAEHFSGFKPWMIPVFSGMVAFIVGNLFWRKSKEVDKLKYEFITVAAHKLRTPLTEIKWAVNALDESNLDSEQKKLTTGISSANTRLITLTDELLSIAKTEAGQYQYKFEPTDFEKMVRSIVNDYQRQMQEKGIKLNYDYDKNTPKANVDKIRMSMVVQILLENAIAYTSSAGGTISINIKKDKNDILFSIKDNGIGISKEDLPYIFSRFYRTHEAYKTETEGTGIGLFLAKSIIDKHNGKIGVNSEGKDKGSEFWVRVKLS